MGVSAFAVGIIWISPERALSGFLFPLIPLKVFFMCFMISLHPIHNTTGVAGTKKYVQNEVNTAEDQVAVNTKGK